MVENQNGYCQRSHKDMTLAVVCDIMTPTIGTVFVCNLKKCCVKADENGFGRRFYFLLADISL